MFAGYATVRGAELAAIESESFGIDHPTVGALWIETIGFPQPVADTIRKSAQPLSAGDAPLDLALRGALAIAAAVVAKSDAEAALATLPDVVRAKVVGSDSKPDSGFVRFYDSLLEVQPTF